MTTRVLSCGDVYSMILQLGELVTRAASLAVRCALWYLYTDSCKLRLSTAMPSISDSGSDIATLRVCL